MTKESVLLSTAYFPPISWMGMFLSFENRTIEYFENYKKQSYRNRCIIFSANGALPLIIPVIKSTGNHTAMSDIKVDYKQNWVINHWRSIEAAYRKTPYFLHYSHHFKEILNKEHPSLIDLNHELLEKILILLRIENKNFEYTHSYVRNPENDLRDAIHPKKSNHGIEISHEYYQPFSHKYGFLKDLSILDLLFNLGPDSADYLSSISRNIRNAEYQQDIQF